LKIVSHIFIRVGSAVLLVYIDEMHIVSFQAKDELRGWFGDLVWEFGIPLNREQMGAVRRSVQSWGRGGILVLEVTSFPRFFPVVWAAGCGCGRMAAMVQIGVTRSGGEDGTMEVRYSGDVLDFVSIIV